MMADEGDIRLYLDSEVGFADVKMADRDLERDGGLETAVLISLFTNRRAEAEDVLPDNSNHRRGWWADETHQDEESIGSRLWLLERSKFTVDLPARAEEYAREALQWMLDDGVAQQIEVTVTRTGLDTLLMVIQIVQPEGDIFFRYTFNWREQLARSA